MDEKIKPEITPGFMFWPKVGHGQNTLYALDKTPCML